MSSQNFDINYVECVYINTWSMLRSDLWIFICDALGQAPYYRGNVAKMVEEVKDHYKDYVID